MLFVNGNENSELANRLVIHNGTGWKGFAYLDDLTTFKDEDFNALKEKVELLSGDVDTDAIINNMKDVEAFLEGFTESQTLMDLLNSKMDKTGGTITVRSLDGFEIKRTSGTLPFIKFSNDTGVLGYLGFSAEGNPSYYDALQQNSYKLIHKGNALDELKGTFLPLTGGTITSSNQTSLIINSTNTFLSQILIQSAGENKARFGWSGSTDFSGYRDGVFMFNNVCTSSIGIKDDGTPYYNDNTLLHTGNVRDYAALKDGSNASGTWGIDITGNAATATALKTPVSLWGNSFDGTKSLDGNITIRNQGTVSFAITDGTSVVDAIQVNNLDNLLIGQGVARNSGDTLIYGNNIKFCYGTAGTSASTAMTITEEGNVRIGTNTYDADAALSVWGRMNIGNVAGISFSLDSLPTSGFVIGGSTHTLAQYLDYNGAFCIQSYHKSTSSSRALDLNPLGGAVNVGEGGLNVKGTLSIADKIALSKNRISTKVAYTAETGGANYIWGYGASDYLCLGAGGTTLTKATSSMVVEYNGLYPGTTNAVSLGTSSYRWSNVYSVNGDFSGRVLIGGAEDDEDYALITKGNWKLTSTDKGDYFSIKLRDVNVDYYGYDAADSWCNHNFISNGTTRFFVAGRDAEWSYIKGKFRAYGEFRAEELATFAAGALIPTGQKLTFGEGGPTMEYDATNNAIKVDGNLYTTGTLAAGGVAEAGESTGGSVNKVSEMIPVNTLTHTVYHGLNTEEVSVQIYERNDGGNWQMILTDVIIDDADNVTISFGAATDREHMCIIL